MTPTISILGFAIGVLIIIKAGDAFVDAAKWLSCKLRIPPFIVGATIVSLATTLPEILVSCIAASEGSTDMAVGNAIGSVTANTGIGMALTILCSCLYFSRRDMTVRGGLLLIALFMLWLCPLIRVGQNITVSLLCSLLLFAVFVAFIVENVMSAKSKSTVHIEKTNTSTLINILKFIFGMIGLGIGSRLLVKCAAFLATDVFHISEAIVGLSIVAIGTSLPETVTAITSVIKKEPGMSVGNIIGANIIDTSLILPLCAFINGGSIKLSYETAIIDIPVCITLAGVAIIPTIFQGKFMRYQGVVLLTLYAAYIVYRCIACNL